MAAACCPFFGLIITVNVVLAIVRLIERLF
jgi:hypothetical protein